MRAETLKEELMVRYLLGDLPDDQQIELEDRAFADRQCMENLLAVENDLIDNYVRGSLSETQRSQFESRFLTSNERRQKVEFARALAEVSARQPEVEAPVTFWQSLADWLRSLNPALQVSLAAASLAAIIGVTWLIRQTVTPPLEVKEIAKTEPMPGPLPTEARRPEPEQPPQPAQPPPAPPPTIASLVLLPGTSRSASERPKLVIPQAASLTRLQVGLERTDDYKGFGVEIRNSQGREIWKRDGLRPQPSRAGRTINLIIPRSLFPTGQYELALKGLTADKKAEDVRYYYFEVNRK